MRKFKPIKAYAKWFKFLGTCDVCNKKLQPTSPFKDNIICVECWREYKRKQTRDLIDKNRAEKNAYNREYYKKYTPEQIKNKNKNARRNNRRCYQNLSPVLKKARSEKVKIKRQNMTDQEREKERIIKRKYRSTWTEEHKVKLRIWQREHYKNFSPEQKRLRAKKSLINSRKYRNNNNRSEEWIKNRKKYQREWHEKIRADPEKLKKYKIERRIYNKKRKRLRDEFLAMLKLMHLIDQIKNLFR